MCSPDIARFLWSIFTTRCDFYPLPELPPFPREVVEEESQEDYGFGPIDIDDPQLIEALNDPAIHPANDLHWESDKLLAQVGCL